METIRRRPERKPLKNSDPHGHRVADAGDTSYRGVSQAAPVFDGSQTDPERMGGKSGVRPGRRFRQVRRICEGGSKDSDAAPKEGRRLREPQEERGFEARS